MINHRLFTWLACAAMLSLRAAAAAEPAVAISSLEELFEIAETNSAQLRPMFAAETEAHRAESEARAHRLPDISASLSVSYIGDGFTTARNYSDYQKAPIPHLGTGLGINVSQPVYAGGAITSAIRLAREKSAATRYATELKRDNLRFAITGFYLDIWKYRNMRTVVEHNLSQARAMLREMTARHDQGMVLRNDITRYELLISNLELELIKINNLINIFSNDLITTCGLPQGSTIEPDTTLLTRALPAESELLWHDRATENSPALKLARSSMKMSRTAADIVRSERLPKIGLQAGWTMDGPILVEVPPINRNLSYWFAGVGVSYNLSSLYKTNKSIARSRAAITKADSDYQAAADDVAVALKADYLHYLEAREELAMRHKSVELACTNYNTTATRYSADMALITDLLDAANSKLEAEQQLVNARINIIYYYYKLLFISGTI